jgi:hypothetical protein
MKQKKPPRKMPVWLKGYGMNGVALDYFNVFSRAVDESNTRENNKDTCYQREDTQFPFAARC